MKSETPQPAAAHSPMWRRLLMMCAAIAIARYGLRGRAAADFAIYMIGAMAFMAGLIKTVVELAEGSHPGLAVFLQRVWSKL